MRTDIVIDQAFIDYLRSEIPGVQRIIESDPELGTIAIDVLSTMRMMIQHIEREMIGDGWWPEGRS